LREPPTSLKEVQAAAIWLMTATLLVGLGFLAILPPFEGFDESAHFSSIRQIAHTGTMPVSAASALDQFVVNYRAHGPTPYGSGQPPFDPVGLSYTSFFKDTSLWQPYTDSYRVPGVLPHFRPSAEQNWEWKHPPLYYIAMAPILRMTDGLSFVGQLFILRVSSLLIALAGLAIAMRAAVRHATPNARPTAAAGFLLYPLMAPMFFPEFARLGNDSLCLLLAGVLWALLLRWRRDGRSATAFAIGCTLGLGLLTKLFFLPITLGVCVAVAWHTRTRPAGSTRSFDLRAAALVLVPAVIIGTGWYVYRGVRFGSFAGIDLFDRVSTQGGLVANLTRHFSLTAFARGLAALEATWQWGGTWSLARINEVVRLPLVLLAAVLGLAYATRLRCRHATDIEWLPMWLIVPLAATMVYYLLSEIADTGAGTTPGWYLHVLAPAFATATGLGLAELPQHARARKVVTALLFYGVLFLVVVLYAEAALFAGCAVKGDDKYYAFAGRVACLDRVPDIWRHVAVYGWPLWGAVAIGAGASCYVIGLTRLSRASAA